VKTIGLTGLLCLAVAGCGGGETVQAPQHSIPADPGSVGRAEIQRQVGNAFDQGLSRLAVMEQPREEAADLGQDLPTGTLTRISCSVPTVCTVQWRTVKGDPRRVGYRVRAFRGGCVTASAQPALPPQWDASIQTTSENPLNTLVGSGEGCS
jgi:hypothetical protein